MNESRYSRQLVLPQFGEEGQAALAKARVAIVGVGALGSASADILARSGVGYLRLIDRDKVELSNLQRCSLYTEADANASIHKALAAAEHLSSINASVITEPHVCEVKSTNVVALLEDVDLVLDGSDNFELRALINEAASKLKVPWIYTGVLGVMGTLMPVMPQGPCLRCLMPAIPEPGTYPTTITSGILASTTRTAATLQATLALRLLIKGIPNQTDDLPTATLLQFDIWEQDLESITVMKNAECPVCGQGHYELLED